MSKPGFGRHSDDYAAYRPGLPASFYQRIDAITRIRESRSLDLATGPGTIALALEIALLAETLHEQSPAGPQDEVVAKRKNITAEVKNELRSFIKGLVPVDVDAEGLRVALDELARETTDRHALPCRFECHDEVSLDDNFAATQLFMIAREAVHNGVKHSGANEIVIQLQDSEGICLTVRDDGCGIPVDVDPQKTMGFRIMRHRCSLIGGTFRLESAPEGGTAVTCSLRKP